MDVPATLQGVTGGRYGEVVSCLGRKGYGRLEIIFTSILYTGHNCAGLRGEAERGDGYATCPYPWVAPNPVDTAIPIDVLRGHDLSALLRITGTGRWNSPLSGCNVVVPALEDGRLRGRRDS